MAVMGASVLCHLLCVSLGKTIHRQPRELIKTGRPNFPILEWKGKEKGEEIRRPKLNTLVTPNSWLVFQLLGLEDKQDWLQTPCSMWNLFADYNKLEDFASNLPVVNDLAERGVAMISQFVNNVEDEEGRQALLQLVEYHRSLVPDCNKASLARC